MEKGPSACDQCCEWWGKTCPGHFLGSRASHTFNLFFAHLLFWSIGFQIAMRSGYVSTNYAEAIAKKGSYGEIESGRWGQGAFPIILAVTLVATFIWLESLVSIFFFFVLVLFDVSDILVCFCSLSSCDCPLILFLGSIPQGVWSCWQTCGRIIREENFKKIKNIIIIIIKIKTGKNKQWQKMVDKTSARDLLCINVIHFFFIKILLYK